MKLVSFFADGQERFGVLLDGNIVDFTSRAKESPFAAHRGIGSLLALIEGGVDGIAFANNLLAQFDSDSSSCAVYSTDDITWRAPVLRPSKICCVAFNNTANSSRILRGPKPLLYLLSLRAH